MFAEDEAEVILDVAGDRDTAGAMCVRREAGEPLEHIIGRVDFGGLRLAVGPGVFVPRQRSVLLAAAAVDAARAVADRARGPVVLEAYCGVAPIAASVRAAVPDAELHATDHDPDALTYARRNLGPLAGIHRGKGFGGLPDFLRRRITVIAAVPPYVPTPARDLLPREAAEHEPHAALFGGPTGMDHIGELVGGAPHWLADAGVLLMEMNVAQAQTLATVAPGQGVPNPAGLNPDIWFWSRIDGDDGQTAVVALTRRGSPG